MTPPPPSSPRPPVFILVFFSMFGFIGLTLLVFLWAQSSREFGAPPLVARLFGSFIAIGFIAVGFGVPASVLFSRNKQGPQGNGPGATPPAKKAGYQCPHCGAGLAKDADVSPSGDIRCSYCQRWWNIHHP
jgi:DNA-directed RNA polymerase subunit RPC12/RpoP